MSPSALVIMNETPSSVLAAIRVPAGFRPGAGTVLPAPPPSRREGFSSRITASTHPSTIIGLKTAQGSPHLAIRPGTAIPSPFLRMRGDSVFLQQDRRAAVGDGTAPRNCDRSLPDLINMHVHTLNRISSSSLRPMRHLRIPLPSTGPRYPDPDVPDPGITKRPHGRP